MSTKNYSIYDDIRARVKHAEGLERIGRSTNRMFARALICAIRSRDHLWADEVADVVENRLTGGSLGIEDQTVVAWIETFRKHEHKI